MSKAELARRIGRNASSIRRLFTASRARPGLLLAAAIADALGGRFASLRSAGRRAPPSRVRVAGARALLCSLGVTALGTAFGVVYGKPPALDPGSR